MPKVNIPAPYNLRLNDRRSRGPWDFRIEGTPEISWLTQEQFSIVLQNVGRRIGDFDEQRDWSGGMGGERFSDDPTKYRDAKEAFTVIPGHLIPSLQWNISTGYRELEQALPGSVDWRGVYGTTWFISRTVAASASSNREKIALWIRRVGSPGTLTVELQSDNTGKPSGTALQSETVTTSTITDVISRLYEFTITAQAVVSGTTYHIVAYGASADDEHSHWEVGVDTSGTASFYKSSAFSGDGTAASFSMYYRLLPADVDRRWWFFHYGANFYKVSNESTATLYKWNETDDDWDVVSGHGLGQITGRPLEANGILYFPQGDSVAIRTYNGTSWDSQTIASGQGCATGLVKGYSIIDNKTQIWRYNNALVSGGTTTGLAKSVSRADVVAAYDTNLAFRNSIRVNDGSQNINNILNFTNNVLWVFGVNHVGYVENDRYIEADYGVRGTPFSFNGFAAVGWKSFLYFNWLHSTERLYAGTLDDVGLGFRGPGLPNGREGRDACYAPYTGSWMFVAKDALDGTSSVLLYDGLNWSEFARAFAAGKRIRDVAIQPVTDARTRLWFDCGGESLYIELPLNKNNPLDDSGAKYMHEFTVESTEIDMGTASKLPKYIEDITMTSRNLGDGIKVYLDHQVDDDIGDTGYSGWVPGGVFLKSPEDTVDLNLSNINKFAYRLRAFTNDQLVPPDVRGIVPNGFARSPMRKVFSITAKVNNGPKGSGAETVVRWLEEASQGAYLIDMNSTFKQLDDYRVVIAPPSIFPIRSNPEQDVVTFSCMAFLR